MAEGSMPGRSVPASAREAAFDCPHCGAYTTQTWFELRAAQKPPESRLPFVVRRDTLERVKSDPNMPPDMKVGILTAWEKALEGLVYFVDTKDKYTRLEAPS